MLTARPQDEYGEPYVLIEDEEQPSMFVWHAGVAVEMRHVPALVAKLQQILDKQAKEQIDVVRKNDGHGPVGRRS